MDYYKIVMDGITNNRRYLEKYFVRECKEAGTKNYGIDEFFDGCNGIVNAMESQLKKMLFDEKKHLYEVLNSAQAGRLKFNEEDKPEKSIEQKLADVKADVGQQLQALSLNDFNVHVHTLGISTNSPSRHNYMGNIPYDDVQKIKNNLILARAILQNEENKLRLENLNSLIGSLEVDNYKPDNQPKLTFEDFLTEDGRLLLPIIVKEYKDTLPRKLVPLLYALSDLGLMRGIKGINHLHLHNALQSKLGEIGTRQALSTSIGKHNQGDPQLDTKIKKAKEWINKNISY